MGHAIRTHFAPPERAAPDEVLRQSRLLSELPFLRAVLDAVPGPLAVLNAQRQVVLANRALAALVGMEDPAGGHGLRPGELLSCVRAGEADCGCGTSQFCRTCGAVHAILSSQGGQARISECRVLRRDHAEALDLRVSAVPLRVGEEDFTLFSLADIGHEKRRHALERVFFHDVLNTAGNLKTLAQVLEGTTAEEVLAYRPLLERIADELLGLIHEQKDLSAAETEDLAVAPQPLSAARLAAEVAEAYRSPGAGVAIRVQDSSGDPTLVSDEILLKRVLGNLVKNALEASGPGDTVTLGYEPAGAGVRFWVHNLAVIPPDVQLQVFQRSFSTKGPGRGLGTYSVRLLTERYLGGRVSFRSSPEEGTVFQVWCPLNLAPRS